MRAGPPFPPWATNEVKCRAEELDPILWQGRQWAVTLYGVEARDGTYYIAKGRLFELDSATYSWAQHMHGKVWVDADDFDQAMEIARRIWPAGTIHPGDSTCREAGTPFASQRDHSGGRP